MPKIIRNKLSQFLLVTFTAFNLQVAHAGAINIVSRGDDNARYAIDMIRLGLQEAGINPNLNIRNDNLSAPKLREELLAGKIDVIWTATNLDLETNALPVRVPLFKGLLGHRVLLIHQNNRNMFAQVRNFQDLSHHTFGQGNGWTDTLIMQANHMQVITATKYEGLFYMTDGQRFDAFPRGVHEPWGEIDSHPDLDLTVDENLMLVYTMPYYLFVSPQQKQLAADLERGLLTAIDNGKFDQLFINNPMVQLVKQKANLKQRRVFKLNNPELPPATPLDNAKLWVDIAKF